LKQLTKFLPIWIYVTKTVTVINEAMFCGTNLIVFIGLVKVWETSFPKDLAHGKNHKPED